VWHIVRKGREMKVLTKTTIHVVLFMVGRLIGGVTVGRTGKNRPPGMLNVKIGPPISFYFGFNFIVYFSRLFFCIFKVFCDGLGF